MSIDQSSFAAWLRAYARARQRPDAALLGGLFTDDALYLATPDAEPLIGRTAIVARWAQLAPPIEPAAFRFEVLAVTESSAIAWWRAPHRSPSAHDRPGSFEAQGIALCTFAADGRCRLFVDWSQRGSGVRAAWLAPVGVIRTTWASRISRLRQRVRRPPPPAPDVGWRLNVAIGIRDEAQFG